MIGKVKTGLKYINIYVAATKADGTKIDPSVCNANVYKVNQADGTEAAVSGSPFAMVKKQAKLGWYGYALDISAVPLTAGQYTVLVEATVDAITTHWTDSFFISDEMKKIADNLDVVLSTRAVESTVAKNSTVAKDATVAKATALATVQTDVTFIKDVSGGKWLIENNQLKLYKADNTTPVATFNLKDAAGVASMKDVFARERV